MAHQNPWLGLSSYNEPKGTDNDYLFCGRDKETLDIVRLIDNNLFVTLYGSSGIGKTSILKAGVMPILRRRMYFPVYVRLVQSSFPYCIQIIEEIERAKQKIICKHNIPVEQFDSNDRLFLWNYFGTSKFFNEEGKELYPVVILDQFEEIFRDANISKAEQLLKQIYPLISDELDIINTDEWSSDTNFRFIASIREDFLFVLEDSIDEFCMDLLKNNRYRLRPMKFNAAKEVILYPGKNCIEEDEKDEVANRIIELSKRDNDYIDSLLLSLICARTYDKKSGERIKLSDLLIWKNSPMEIYYKEAVESLAHEAVRFIQMNLIRENGARVRVNSLDIINQLGEDIFRELTTGGNHILTIGENNQVELLHDQLAKVIYEEKKSYDEREKQKVLEQQRWKVLEIQSRFVSAKASELVDEGSSNMALKILHEILPEKLSTPSIPYTEEAEFSLRKASTLRTNHYILRGHEKSVRCVEYNPSGELLASSSTDGTVRIWDVNSGKCRNIYHCHPKVINSVSFSPKGDRIVTASGDKLACVWDARTGECLMELQGHAMGICSAYYSPDGKTIITASRDNSIRIWDVNNGHCVFVLSGHTSFVNSAKYSPDGHWIISASSDYTARLWDAHKGICKKVLKGHNNSVYSASFSKDSTKIVTASDDRNIIVWDLNGTVLKRFEGHEGGVLSAEFSNDTQKIISASIDKTIRIWDFKTSFCLQSLSYHKNSVNYLAFSPIRSSFASASSDGTIHTWDLEKREYSLSLPGHAHVLSGDRIFYDNFYGDNFTIGLIDINKGEEIFKKNIIQSDGSKAYVVLSPNGNLCGVDDGNSLMIHDMTNSVIWEIENANRILPRTHMYGGSYWESRIWGWGSYRIQFLGNNHVMTIEASEKKVNRYLGGNTKSEIRWKVDLWNIYSKQVILSVKGENPPYLFMSPDEHLLAIDDGMVVKILNMSSKTIILELRSEKASVFQEHFNEFDFHEERWGKRGESRFLNNKYVLILVKANNETAEAETIIWNTETQQKVLSFNDYNIEISPSADEIIAISRKKLGLWDLQTGRNIKSIDLESLPKSEICKKIEERFQHQGMPSAYYSLDSRFIVLNYAYDTYLFDKNLTLLKLFEGGRVLDFIPGGKVLVQDFRIFGNESTITLSCSGAIRVWDVDTLESNIETYGSGYRISRNGVFLVTTTEDMKLVFCDLNCNKVIKTTDSHADEILSIDISPCNDYVVSSSVDKTIRVWTINTGKCVQIFKGHTERVTNVSFSSDGNKIISMSTDGTTKIWDFPPLQNLINQTKEKFKNDPLTLDERRQYYLE